MLLQADGKPYTKEELRPSCPKCGSIERRKVLTGFGGHWRLTCRCGHEFVRGRGELPEGEV